MMAPTKNRMRPTAEAIPISGMPMPTSSPSAPAALIGLVLVLSKTRRTGNRPIEIARLHDFFHGKRIAHVVLHDKTGNPIGNSGKMRRRRENDQPFHSGTVHCSSRRKCTVVEH